MVYCNVSSVGIFKYLQLLTLTYLKYKCKNATNDLYNTNGLFWKHRNENVPSLDLLTYLIFFFQYGDLLKSIN